jgi:AraC-like DNA-binding protein
MRPIELQYRQGLNPSALLSGFKDAGQSGRFSRDQFIKPKKNFDIYLHDRYGKSSEHCHDFIEMVYVYSGECVQWIEGSDFQMHAGDLCILNTVTRHFIKDTEEKDVIVNLLFDPAFFDYRFFGNMGSNDLFSDFFMRSIYQGDNIKRYLLFTLHDNERIKQIITDIMCEHYSPGICSDEIIDSSLILLFAELLRANHGDKNSVIYNKTCKDKLSDVISYIENNYRTAALKTVASHFGYSAGHFGALLKEAFDKTFTDIRHEIRMMNSAKMLLSTSMPISEIANTIGLTNLSHFYLLFRRKFGVTPQEYRLQSQGLREAERS